jgi:hypothetical protein
MPKQTISSYLSYLRILVSSTSWPPGFTPGLLVGPVLVIFLVFCVMLCLLFRLLCLRSMSCVSNVISVSGLSILDFPLRFSITFTEHYSTLYQWHLKCKWWDPKSKRKQNRKKNTNVKRNIHILGEGIHARTHALKHAPSTHS